MKPRRNSRHRWVDYYYLISVGKSTKNIWNRQKKSEKFWNKWLFYVLEHKTRGWGIKRNQTESNGIIRNDFAESFGIITRNDRKNDRKWLKTTENDRKRPRKRVVRLEVEEWIPRKFPDFPCIFLGNSPISPEILWFSPKFSDFPRFSPIFSDFFPNFAVFLHYNIY